MRKSLTSIRFEYGAAWAHNQVQTVVPFSGDGVLRLPKGKVSRILTHGKSKVSLIKVD